MSLETYCPTNKNFKYKGDLLICNPINIEGQNVEIECDYLLVLSKNVTLKGLRFKCSVLVNGVSKFHMDNCSIYDPNPAEGSLYLRSCSNVVLNDISILNSGKVNPMQILDSSVMASNLKLANSSETLLVCHQNSSLVLSNSKFENGEANAINVSESSITIVNCKISNIKYPALYLSNSKVIAKKNQFDNVEQNCISVNECNNFKLEENEITSIGGSAISIMDESSGTITNNVISNYGGNGIFVSKSSNVVAKCNELLGGKYPGIAILIDSKAELINNKIYRSEFSGICVRGANNVLIDSCSISNSSECGISISDTKKCIIKNNKFEKCNYSIIESYNRSNVIFENNEANNIGQFGFLVFSRGTIEATNNKISNVDTLAKLSYRGSAIITNNQVKNCKKQSICETSGKYLFKNNGNFSPCTNDPTIANENNIKVDPPFEEIHLCLKCKKNKRTHFLMKCGHFVYCSECAKSALKNNECCPLCRFPIDSISPGYESAEDNKCVICLENEADCVIVPCSHLGYCEECLIQWFKRNQTCPTCRNSSMSFIKIQRDV